MTDDNLPSSDSTEMRRLVGSLRDVNIVRYDAPIGGRPGIVHFRLEMLVEGIEEPAIHEARIPVAFEENWTFRQANDEALRLLADLTRLSYEFARKD